MGRRSRWLDWTVAAIWIAVGLATWWSEIWRIPVWVVQTEWARQTSDERIRYDNVDALRAEGDALVAAILAFRAREGRLPEDLSELPDPPPGHEDWRYGTFHPGHFHVGIGTYSVHHFSLSWSTRTGEWSLDA